MAQKYDDMFADDIVFAALQTATALSVKPEVKPSMFVTLVVQDTKRRTLSRTMRRTDKLQDLMDYYYDMMSTAITHGEGRFLFDGGRVNGEKTPEDYDMVSGDKIDFFPDLMGA